MKQLRTCLGVLTAWAAALALLAMLTDALGGSPAMMLRLMEQHAPAASTGLAQEDYPAAARMITRYLSGSTEEFQLAATVHGEAVSAAFHDREQSHMADVRQLFVLARALALGLTALTLLCTAALWFLRRPDRRGLRGLRWGLSSVLTVLAALLLWGIIDFDSLFVAFHRLAFTNDLWLLDPRQDLLIRLMPTDFFTHYAALIGGTWLGMLCLGEAAVTWALRPRRSGSPSTPWRQ